MSCAFRHDLRSECPKKDHGHKRNTDATTHRRKCTSTLCPTPTRPFFHQRACRFTARPHLRVSALGCAGGDLILFDIARRETISKVVLKCNDVPSDVQALAWNRAGDMLLSSGPGFVTVLWSWDQKRCQLVMSSHLVGCLPTKHTWHRILSFVPRVSSAIVGPNRVRKIFGRIVCVFVWSFLFLFLVSCGGRRRVD